MQPLEELRARIDRIDKDLTELFQQRMALVAQVAAHKRANALPVRDCGREDAILANISNVARPDLAPYIRDLFEAMFNISRNYQNSL